MSLPLVTRFGADPLLDLEVANKRYVDNSGGGSSLFWMNNGDFDIESGSTDDFQTVWGDSQAPFTTESARPSLACFDFTWSRLMIRLTANTKATVDCFSRLAGVDGNQVINALSATGIFQDTVNTDDVVNEVTINYKNVRSAGGSVTLVGMSSAGLPV